jgi:hypothetical protein
MSSKSKAQAEAWLLADTGHGGVLAWHKSPPAVAATDAQRSAAKALVSAGLPMVQMDRFQRVLSDLKELEKLESRDEQQPKRARRNG